MGCANTPAEPVLPSSDAGQDAGSSDSGTPNPTPPDLCGFAFAAEPGPVTCTASADCGALQLCIGGAGPDGESLCAQACFPYACDPASCGSGFTCLDLQSADGSLLTLDVNGDLEPDIVGACFEDLPAEPSTDWGACGAGVVCPTTSVCLGVGSSGTGICLPLCTDACAPYSGFFTECLGLSSGQSVCGIRCDPSEGSFACPPGLRCSLAGTGVALCGF
jgi:hypothetical protein